MAFETTTKIFELFHYLDQYSDDYSMTQLYYEMLKYSFNSKNTSGHKNISGKGKVKALLELFNDKDFIQGFINQYKQSNVDEFINLVKYIIDEENYQDLDEDYDEEAEEDSDADMPELISDVDEEDNIIQTNFNVNTPIANSCYQLSEDEIKSKWKQIMNPILFEFYSDRAKSIAVVMLNDITTKNGNYYNALQQVGFELYKKLKETKTIKSEPNTPLKRYASSVA